MSDGEYRPPSSTDSSGTKSETIEYLREYGPATASEVPGNPTSNRTREVVGRLKIAGTTSAAKHRGGGIGGLRQVYYLYGDERRAVRRFIKEHTEWVKTCLSDPGSPLHEHSLHSIFVEEWEWGDWEVDRDDE